MRGGYIRHMNRIALATLVFIAPAVASADYPAYTPEDYDNLACDYDLPIIWNSDYLTPAAMCAMKASTEFDAIVVECANSSAAHCLDLAVHIVDFYLPCFEMAAKRDDAF